MRRRIRRLRFRLAAWLMPRPYTVTLPPVSGAERVPQWCDGAIPKRITGAAVEVITGLPAILVHATIIGGAAATRLDIYNKKEAPIDVTKRVDALIAAAGEDDMFSNKPIRCGDGIIAQMNAADGEGFVYYVPLV